jgi:hypothetical protein
MGAITIKCGVCVCVCVRGEMVIVVGHGRSKGRRMANEVQDGRERDREGGRRGEGGGGGGGAVPGHPILSPIARRQWPLRAICHGWLAPASASLWQAGSGAGAAAGSSYHKASGCSGGQQSWHCQEMMKAVKCRH